MTSNEFAKAARNIAENFNTLYVMGGLGGIASDKNKKRYTSNNDYNKTAARKKKILNAAPDTFFFDCCGLIKAILCGWNGSTDARLNYGGAVYPDNRLINMGANAMIAKCTEVGDDVINASEGELVWQDGHIGIALGNGYVVECTPSWKDRVQITCMFTNSNGYPVRKTWAKHGKFPDVTYVSDPIDIDTPTYATIPVRDWQKAAIADGYSCGKCGADGKFGSMTEKAMNQAVCRRRPNYPNRNLTKLIQMVVGTPCDGLYGYDTERLVQQYQKDMGLEIDGVVGIKTWKRMCNV